MAEKKTMDEILFDEIKANVQPGASLKHIKPDLDRVESKFFSMYDGKPVGEDKVEAAFNSVAKSYITTLYDLAGKPQPLVDGPEWYGNTARDWLGKVSEQAVGQVKAAIKQGNRAEVLRLINQGYEAQANKLTSIISNVQNQPADIHLDVNKRVASALGGKNVAKVAANLPAAVSALAQIYATQDAYK